MSMPNSSFDGAAPASRPVAQVPRLLGGRLLRQVAAFALLAAILCLPALINGQGFFYPDTPTYIRGAEMGAAKVLGERARPWLAPAAAGATPAGADATAAPAERNLKPLTSIEDKIVLAGRSVYYGALLYAAYAAGSLWLAVIAQAACVAYLLQLLLVRLRGHGERQLLVLGTCLSLLTPLGSYVGFFMPDIFASVAILCCGLLVAHWPQLRRADRVALAALLLFAVCAHSSHLALLAVLLATVACGAALAGRSRPVAPAVLVMAACVLAGLAAEWAFDKAVTRAMGAPPLRLPHPMARLIALGPGTTYLRQNCPKAGYAVCAYVANFPTPVDDFLFSVDASKGAFALADAATKRRMSQEQLAFAAEVIRHDPVGVLKGLVAETAQQVVSFRVDLWDYGKGALEHFYAGRVPPDVYDSMRHTLAARHFWPIDVFLSATTYVATVAVLLLAFVRRGRGRPRDHGLFNEVLVAGVLANAVICGALAYPLDRFQARVIWLVPLLGAIALWTRPRPKDEAPRSATA